VSIRRAASHSTFLKTFAPIAILSKAQCYMQEGDDEADSAMVGKFAQVFFFSCNWILIIFYKTAVPA